MSGTVIVASTPDDDRGVHGVVVAPDLHDDLVPGPIR